MTNECDGIPPKLPGRLTGIVSLNIEIFFLDNETNGFGDTNPTFRICCLGSFLS